MSGDPPVKPSRDETADQFESLSQAPDPGIVREFIGFLKYNKKWWLTPIVLVTLALVGLAFLAPSPVAPFIYALF